MTMAVTNVSPTWRLPPSAGRPGLDTLAVGETAARWGGWMTPRTGGRPRVRRRDGGDGPDLPCSAPEGMKAA
jgi:hypothetical protein